MKVFTITIETFNGLVENLLSKKESILKEFLYKDMQVVLQHSQNFYLKCENDLKILKDLHLNNGPSVKIALKEPKSKIFFSFEGENVRDYIELPYLKSHDVLLFLLRNNYNIKGVYGLRPNIDDPTVYAQLIPNSSIIISPVQITESPTRRNRCKCGGDRVNNRCSIVNCRFN